MVGLKFFTMLIVLIEIAVIFTISALLSSGVSTMVENHPDYKGEDFLN